MTMLDIERQWLEALPRDNNSVLMREIVKRRHGTFHWVMTTNLLASELIRGPTYSRSLSYRHGLTASSNTSLSSRLGRCEISREPNASATGTAPVPYRSAWEEAQVLRPV